MVRTDAIRKAFIQIAKDNRGVQFSNRTISPPDPDKAVAFTGGVALQA
jgi:hypothetical protein